MRKCTKCGLMKEESEFCKTKRRKDGLHSWCKICHAAGIRDYRMRLKRNKLCTSCGINRVEEGRVRCPDCSLKHNMVSKGRLNRYSKNRQCSKCGRPVEKNYKMCECCRLKNNKRQKEMHRSFSAKVGAYYNNQCYICGLKSTDYEIYECHHLEPSVKESQISLLSSKDWNLVVVPELEKCVYLCKICHARLHAGRFDVLINNKDLVLIPGKILLESVA